MTLDLSKLDDKVYLLPTDITAVRPLSEKKLFYYPYSMPGRLQQGQVYEQNILIPRKQLAKVRIETNGTIMGLCIMILRKEEKIRIIL